MLELNADERNLVDGVEHYLDSRDSNESELVKKRFECLNALGMAISQYPSIRESHQLRGVQRSEEQLLEALCSIAASARLLHTPAKVIGTRSYLIAKFQAFSLLHILVGENEEFILRLRRIILSIIHTLMAEEVYFSCLDDPGFSYEIKLNLANDLIALWDSGTTPHTVQHLPTLGSLDRA